MNQIKQTEILLESGTNELEIMEFTIAGEVYGMNVAKVKEIMHIMPVKPMQKADPFIEGIFKPREEVIPVVDLGKYLGLPASTNPERDIFIIASFNLQVFAFHVHTVVGIDRISWTQIKKTDRIIYGGQEGVATGIADFESRLITILDFEKIIAEISPETSIKTSGVEKMGQHPNNKKPILIAEDSMLLAKMILESLHKAGYQNVTKTDDGKEAWDYLQKLRDEGGNISDKVACIISDIEMPQMDGHHLTKLVKTDPVLKKVPLVLFSSLITEDMRRKGKELGADEQISKPEIVKLVSILDRLTGNN